ncbi:MAG: hypothetical protein KF760_21320 [Candidatus Eremiobacteraeota bacterium]|nr:hypothetical protein [Candidatus Eremiobacteraeota bacterium]MCW5867543.1 hypothetical protein [Candidatus Eremiobacteraeota bacterium]
MAVAQQYSYRYRILWDEQPRVALAGQFGVGPEPLVEVREGRLHLTPRSGDWAYPGLDFWLPEGLQPYDMLDLECTPLNMHRSCTWTRYGEVQFHLGHLPNLSGTVVGGAMLEVVNEIDQDGCLALYQRGWSQRLRPGQQGRLGDYHFFLSDLNGLVTGSSYRAYGWLGLQRFSAQQLESWCSS